MTAQVVITRQNVDTPAVGGLFSGLSFFLLQRLPMRSHFLSLIQSNGGRVVKLENQADYIVADHTRPDCPPGSISFTFVETAIRTGALPDPQDHATKVPKGVAREAGSGAPIKSTRTPFSAEDDRVLWNWVKRCGGPVKGNEIYKQLEAENARHTWQAWRDRYVKRLATRPPEGVEVTVSANPPPSPPTAPDEQVEIQAQVDGVHEDIEVEQGPAEAQAEHREIKEGLEEDEFTEEDVDLLLTHGSDIEDVDEEKELEAWNLWAKTRTDHSAEDWRRFWKEDVRPIHLKRKAAEEQAQEGKRKAATASDEAEAADMYGIDEGAHSRRETNTSAAVTSSLQKRKRAAFVSPSKYGRKKRKSASDEMFEQSQSDEEHEIDPQASNQALPTSEFNRQAQRQLRQESGVVSESALPELPIQEAVEGVQAEAQAQFDDEVLGIARGPQTAPTLNLSNPPTSDVNDAADQQLTQESLERQGEDDQEHDESSELKSISVSSGEDVRDDGSLQNEERNTTPQHELETPSAPLTEANLASQQAQHNAPLLRGSDLLEDNDARDADQQDEFVRYLHGVASRPEGAHESHVSVAVESQLPQDALHPNAPLLSYSANLPDPESLLMSSQNEIDEVLEDMIQWPSSPVASSRREISDSQSQSLRMETQAPYPILPSQRSRISPFEQEQMFSSQHSMVPEVSYPPLRQGETSLQNSQPTGQTQQNGNEEDGSTIEESMSSQQRAEKQEDGELDFAIPAPLGGWSSPPKSQSAQATPIATRQIRIKSESHRPEDSPQRSQVVIAQDVVEVSSTSSSSSSSSEEDDPEAAPSTPTAAVRRKALETQDILDAETQQPDFDLPLPPDSPHPSSSVSNPSSSPPPNAAESQRALADSQPLDEGGVDMYITTGRVKHGYADASMVAALKCTSLRSELADLVLLYEKLGKGLPDVAGVWSKEEDRLLESGNAEALRRLEEKHTWAEMQARMEFLEEYREEE